MKVAVIAPVYDLDLCDELSHTYMALQFLCKKDPQYKSHWMNIRKKNLDAYILLDNNANEGCMCTGLELLSMAADIKPDEIVCPDVYLDAEATVESTTKFLDEYYKDYIDDNFQTMAVLQGKDKESFLKCYDAFLNDYRINVLGVGYKNLMKPFRDDIDKLGFGYWKKLGIDAEHIKNNVSEDCYYYTFSRMYFFREVLDWDKLKKARKLIHCLGIWNPIELSFYKKCLTKTQMKYIRSCDSAIACQAAQTDIKFDETFGVYDKPKSLLDFEDRLSTNQKKLVKENIEIMKKWLV